MSIETMILGWNKILCITDWYNILNITEKYAIMWHAPITISLKFCLKKLHIFPSNGNISNWIEIMGIFKPEIAKWTYGKTIKLRLWGVIFFFHLTLGVIKINWIDYVENYHIKCSTEALYVLIWSNSVSGC